MKGLVAATRYLTIVPVPGAWSREAPALGEAAVWFPVVGLLLGGALALVDQVAIRLFPPLLAALLTVTAWKLLSGGLHLDGLADCLDGLPGRDSEHRLRIMRDSRIGTFGAVGLILVLLLELAALTELVAAMRWRVLLVAPAVGRAMPALLGRLFRPARPDGAGARFAAGLRRRAWIAPALALAVAAAALAAAGVAAFLAAVGLSIVVGAFFARRLGGVTGDVMGAVVELSELAVLLVIAARAHGMAAPP
ncbi:MAG: adenosylcobinamide-GDP ribazoletransferase [Candidatus Rokubacteria bacterium]|nr:adenosylcobinamide-GDP ribazoletransferase [Candidatus Rokubacteria bacterium]MBI3824468.1 adenosylcobinamide-GDP ribazoletransferase [Candidatus Rokubacteria bacterium]